MPESTTTDPLDTELRRIARALVAEAPDAPVLPAEDRVDGVVIRLDPPPRHRAWTAVAAAAVVVVVGVVAGLLAAVGDDEPGDDQIDMAAGTERQLGEGQIDLAGDAGLEPAPQRLILLDTSRELWRELPRDGGPVPLELAGLDPNGAPRPLPGGGHVVVGVHPVPAPPPEGFNEFTDLTYSLAVVDAGGEVTIERDIERATLVGATAAQAILARQPRGEDGRASGPISIVAHDLATGDERLVRGDVEFDPHRMSSAGWAIVGGDLVAVEASQLTEPISEDAAWVVPGSEECTLTVTDLATGEVIERPLDLDCGMIQGLQASPDGARAAVAYETSLSGPADPPELRLAVIDLPGGAVRHEQFLGHDIDCRAGDCPSGTQALGYQGMAWDDAATLRVATADLATSPADLATSPGDLIVHTIDVG